jgi:hypothetical protein
MSARAGLALDELHIRAPYGHSLPCAVFKFGIGQ